MTLQRPRGYLQAALNTFFESGGAEPPAGGAPPSPWGAPEPAGQGPATPPAARAEAEVGFIFGRKLSFRKERHRISEWIRGKAGGRSCK